MKRFLAAAAVVAFMASPAYAQLHGVTDQGQGGRIGPPPAGLKDSDKVDEKAYEAAVKRMPAETKKVDPWAIVRDKPQPK
jgi:hypothetical protein